MINLILLILAFSLDMFLGSFMGLSLIGVGLSITPNITFLTLLLITYKEDKFKAITTAIFVGLSMDVFNTDILFVNTFVYLLCVLVVMAWSMRINDSIIELLFLMISAISLKEFLLFFYFKYIMGYTIPLSNYLLGHFTYTLIFNLIFIIIGVIIKKSQMDRDIYKQQINKRRGSMSSRY